MALKHSTQERIAWAYDNAAGSRHLNAVRSSTLVLWTKQYVKLLQTKVEGLSIRLGEVSALRDSAIFGQRLFVNRASLGPCQSHQLPLCGKSFLP